ncbi:alpha/beta fold hydrolase [Candidatus Dependentiae bacterium]|nr:alpha/beta fold hydrolase [Candidatus Dependentiae bacterium]
MENRSKHNIFRFIFKIFFLLLAFTHNTQQVQANESLAEKNLANKNLVSVSVIQNNVNQSFSISSKLKQIANYLYKNLNFSPLFITANLLDPKKMRSQLLTPYLCDGKNITVKTSDGETIHCTFFDRNSKKLLIIGTGFGNEREKVAPLIHMFDKYDIVIFDYRGHGYDQPKLLDTSQWLIKPNQKLQQIIDQITPYIDWAKVPNLNINKTTLGMSEEKDLLAAINHFKEKKSYEKLFGIGFCFSSFVLAKTAAQNPGLFNKIILDSSMHSPQNIINRITESPQLLFDPQRGSWSSLLKTNSYDTNLLSKLVSTFLQKSFSKLSITIKTTDQYLSQLQNTPVLFFHGKGDLMTPYNEDFMKNFTQTKIEEKAAIIFENSRHLTNHIKYKELYKAFSKSFFELPYNSFISSLKNPESFVKYEFDLAQQELAGLG